jgi:glycosyltransferase involved in cell wall biosynthesis
MRIAINTRLLLPGRLEGMGWYTYELCKRLSEAHPEDEFFFFFDRPFDPGLKFGPNVNMIVLGPRARFAPTYWWWFEVVLPKAFKKYGIEVFFSPDNFCSLRSKVPTALTIHDLSPLHFPVQFAFVHRWHYLYYLPRFMKRAERVISVSNYGKTDIQKTVGISGDKIAVIPNGARAIFAPVAAEVQADTRAQFSTGEPYFVFIGSLNGRKNLARLVQAYDSFRQNSQSQVKLVLAGRRGWQLQAFDAALQASPYRQDILLLSYVEEKDLPRLLGSALGLVYVSTFEGFGLPVLEAMCCDTPVICSHVSSLPEVAGEAALLVDPYEVQSISNAMLRLWQEPDLRQILIEKARLQRLPYSWSHAAEELYLVLKGIVRG